MTHTVGLSSDASYNSSPPAPVWQPCENALGAPARRRPRASSDSSRQRELGVGPRKLLIPRAGENTISKRKRSNSVESANSAIWRPFSFLLDDTDTSALDSPPSRLDSINASTQELDVVTFDDEPTDTDMSQQLEGLTIAQGLSSDMALRAAMLGGPGNKQAVNAAVSRLLLSHKQGTPKELKVKALRLVQQILQAVRSKKVQES